MSTKTGTIEFEYKKGVTDKVICQLEQNNSPIDLSVFDSVVLNINNGSGASFPVPCTIGNSVYSASQGGVTINFTGVHLAEEGEYDCEFVAYQGDDISIIPNGNEYYILMVYPAVQVST